MKRWGPVIGILVVLAAPARAADDGFDFEVLQYRAKTMAAQPFHPRKSNVPGWLQKYTYDQFRDIRFNPMRALWREENLPFQIQFFHPGGIFNTPVRVNTLEGKKASMVEFSTKLFDYGANHPGRIPTDLGFAGFRIHYALNTPKYLDELAVFLGASYFRALGRGEHYGISARGLAIDTGEPGGEEFPVFDEFWIERPAPNATAITVYALLDSASVTGAYKFVIEPGTETLMRVRAAVYCRKNPKVFEMAPLTSMFAHGENTAWSRDDFRPEVHDSDGLLMETGEGEWIWRPLANPKFIRIASFTDKDPRGFGLLQRDREFEHYDDLEAYYHERPSLWVEPVGKWGPGVVRLVELPTPNEFNDNIVACWVPEKLPAPGDPIEFEYILHWMRDPGQRPANGFTVATRLSTVEGQPDLKRFTVDFAGPYLNAQPEDPAIEAMLAVSGGGHQTGRTVVQKNNFNGGWRVTFEVKPDAARAPVELRCFLRKGSHVLTETWSYLWNP